MEKNLDFRFSGTEKLYGKENFSRIEKAHVMVVGLGGVGSWAAEALVRSGVGRMTLVDLDDICTSNANRQIHALTSTLGKSKALELKARFEDINPSGSFEARQEWFDKVSAESLLALSPDIVIDAIDGLTNKTLLIGSCWQKKIPIVVTGGAGGRSKIQHIKVTDLSRTTHDPLLFYVRRRLRQNFQLPKTKQEKFEIPCIYSDERVENDEDELSMSDSESRGSRCGTHFGTATFITGTFGFYAAQCAIEILAIKAKPLT